ncbi:InlB B-repeat-containing protein [Spirochaetia bacterium 38H-sp]|uniref:InlB B-repeat-containing protein n=1 Tax=Rarispira pelagica TaxID=3141764 RepID=A0ABU9UCJ5_9SPIR
MKNKSFYFLLFIIITIITTACPVMENTSSASHVLINTGVELDDMPDRQTSLTDITSFYLTVSAKDMETISRTFASQEIALDVPSGLSRVFTLEARDNNGSILFSGQSTVDLYPGDTVTVKITMRETLYTITFDKQGGTGGTTTVTAEYNQPMPAATAPTKIGYTFAGYFDSPSGGVQYYMQDMSSARDWDKRQNTTLYAQWLNISYTFTTADATGRQGPSQSQLDAAYTGTNLEGSVTASSTGIQKWTVPNTGTYRIIAYGASGANAGSSSYGRGAHIEGEFSLSAGDVLWILVGQQGLGAYVPYANLGGGGGSFVSRGADLATSTLLIAAGGGGAVGASATSDSNGQASENGAPGYHDDYFDPGNTSNNQGGTGGNAGGAGNETGMDSAAGINKSDLGSTAAQSFFSGGLGSQVAAGTNNGDGGFGGGGARIENSASGTTYATAGGGGGYSGGGASDGTNGMPFYGGGGGSYNTGANPQNITGGAPVGDGKVEIIYLGP